MSRKFVGAIAHNRLEYLGIHVILNRTYPKIVPTTLICNKCDDVQRVLHSVNVPSLFEPGDIAERKQVVVGYQIKDNDVDDFEARLQAGSMETIVYTIDLDEPFTENEIYEDTL